MTQEEKDILMKDLCARLPYGVKILHEGWNYEWDQELSTLEKVTGIDERFIYTKVINDNGEEYTSSRHTISLLDDKPYLFPLSSMTEEQKEEYCGLQQKVIYNSKGLINSDVMEYVNWCYKNHIDINNLIPMGLAKDARGLNIY